jgi:ribosome biogenesis GTPase A
MEIQWYPGHMTKTRRMIVDQIRKVDAVCEILDARIPASSRNPDMDDLTLGKPRLIILNRVDQADPDATRRWAAFYRKQGCAVLESNAKQGTGTKNFSVAIRTLLADKLRAYSEKGQAGRTIRVMILGIPNVGKSTLINQIAHRKTAKVEDRPGVTRSGQWVPIDRSLELLDTPGILWPKFEDPRVGLMLAYTGAVKDDILDIEDLGCHLMEELGKYYPEALETRYKISPKAGDSGYDLLVQAGKKRGFLISGGEVDTERMAKILLDEFRGGKLGQFTLEFPENDEL